MKFSHLVHIVIEIMETIQKSKSFFSKCYVFVEYDDKILSIDSAEFYQNKISGYDTLTLHCHD